MPTELLPENLGDYEVDSHSIQFKNGVTVTVTRDGVQGVGVSRTSVDEAFQASIEALKEAQNSDEETKSAVVIADEDDDEPKTVSDEDESKAVSDEDPQTPEVSPSTKPTPFDFSDGGGS